MEDSTEQVHNDLDMGANGMIPWVLFLHQHIKLDMLSARFCHVRAVIHDKHCFMRFRKNLHLVLTCKG